MERAISFRVPARSKSEGLSKTAKTFFGLNIFQVFTIGGIQGAMIIWGDFSPVSVGGLGPGRKVYMALFMGAVLYSCFLCLFAVKKQNYLEILAFVFQNYGYIVYSCIQVYHISFKKYEDHDLRRQKNLVYLTLIDSGGLFVLNIIFTYLAVKLYGEYGWKIYKRVRFNIRLRAAFHIYQTVIMLLKMVFLFLTMYTICLTQTVLRGQYKSFSYIASLTSVLVCILLSITGIIAIRREKKILALVFILGVGAAICYFIFKMIQVATKTCSDCVKVKDQADDIPGEVELHLMYLASMNILFLIALLLASIKAVRNFGIGLAAHFRSEPSSTMTVLSLSRNMLSSIIPSSVDDTQTYPDIESPRPSVSNEPRPSIFQYLPKLLVSSRHSYVADDDDQNKGFTLPAKFRKREKLSKQLQSSAKSRISQLFWESELGHISRSQQSSFSNRHSSSCFESCCPWKSSRGLSFSTYGIPVNNEHDDVESNVIESQHQENDVDKNSNKRRKRSRSLEIGEQQDIYPSKIPLQRFSSLPSENLVRTENVHESREELQLLFKRNRSSSTGKKNTAFEFEEGEFSDRRESKEDQCANDAIKMETHDCESMEFVSRQRKEKLMDLIGKSNATRNKLDRKTEVQITHSPLRRIKSSISSLTSLKTESTELDSDDSDIATETGDNDKTSNYFTRQRKLGIVLECPEQIRKAVSDYEISSKSKASRRIHFV